MQGGSEEARSPGRPGFFALCRRRSFKISIFRAFVEMLLSEVTGPAISIDEEPGVIEEMKRLLNGLAEAHFEKLPAQR